MNETAQLVRNNQVLLLQGRVNIKTVNSHQLFARLSTDGNETKYKIAHQRHEPATSQPCQTIRSGKYVTNDCGFIVHVTFQWNRSLFSRCSRCSRPCYKASAWIVTLCRQAC